MLKIYNTLTKTKESFTPIAPGKVNIYVCGMTVYDFCHIGHARSLVCFDVVVRYLRHLGYTVKYLRNITDIDDKIIQRAHENQEGFQVLTERFIVALQEDMAALGLLTPDEEPCATESIPQIVRLIQKLLDNGYAYIAENGDVYYDISRFPSYGKLSRRNLKELRAGARVDVSKSKRDPLDFVLWKTSKEGEPSWDTPWGQGRPGWHIECSAMAMHGLAEQIDIHGGGADLIFPHHENEIAQSEAATGKPFANVWMHVGHLHINKEKMSKSLGNFITIREILKKCAPEVLRYVLISSHYRNQLNYSEEALSQGRQALERLYVALKKCASTAGKPENTDFEQRFIAAMDDDFNTPEALAVLFDLAREINRQEDVHKAASMAALLKHLGGILGILQQAPETFLQSGQGTLSPEQIAHINTIINKLVLTRTVKNP